MSLKKRYGVKHAIALNSCTAALHLALIVHEVGQGDEVITSNMTFCASANVICHVGATPVLVDIRSENLCIDTEALKKAITPKTKAIIVVHYGGGAANMDEIIDICEQNNIIVIEDAAHGLETKYKNKYIGTIGDVGAFSFYATKKPYNWRRWYDSYQQRCHC